MLSRLTRVDIKLLRDRRKGLGDDRFLAQLHRGKYRVQIPLQLFVQSIRVAVGILILILLNLHQVPYAAPLALLTTVAVMLILSHWLPWAVTGTEPERVLLILLPFLRPVLVIGIPLTYPIIHLAARRHAASADNEAGEDEITDEEVQAFLDVGEEEGIFEQEESRIIQQVVELGDTIAREIMVPRTEIVAIPVNATQEELRALIVKSRHSRIPVFEGSIDAIVGVVYVRHLLAGYSSQDPGTSLKVSSAPPSSCRKRNGWPSCSARCRPKASRCASWWTSTGAWRDWSRSKTSWRRSSGKSGTRTSPSRWTSTPTARTRT